MDDTWWRKPDELDEDQRAIINELPIDADHLIQGPPGSGKTNILMLRATYLHLQGYHDSSIITFNRTLKEFLSTGVGHYDFQSAKIKTFVKWGVEVLEDHGMSLKLEDDFEASQKTIGEALLALSESGASINRSDYIFLDEAQDYTALEIDLFRKFGKRVFAVGDIEQQIYEGKDGLDRLKEFCHLAPKLKYHYRNGKKICRIADGLRNRLDSGSGLQATSQYVEASNPSSVELVESATVHDQAIEIVRRLEAQLLAYPDERLGVACPRHAELEVLWEHIRVSSIGDKVQLQSSKNGYSPFSPDKPICLTTLHGTKGMEFRAMHIAGVEYLSNMRKFQRSLIYTGATRAKTSLTIHYSGGIPGYLENAVESVREKKAKPSLDQLFKGAK